MAINHELVLYVMTGCPYCIKVKRFLTDNGVTIPERNISTDADAERTLIAVGGKRQVPCLFIDGKPLYESSDIIAWVQENLLSHAHCNRLAPTHTAQTCAPASKVDHFRHLWMLVYSFLKHSRQGIVVGNSVPRNLSNMRLVSMLYSTRGMRLAESSRGGPQ